MKKDFKNFCYAPFHGIFQHYDGTSSVCCHRPIEINANSMEEFVKDEKLLNFQKSWSKEDISSVCKNCPDQMRNLINEKIHEFLPEKNIEKYLNTNIKSTFEPIILYFSWSNKCNFACLGCDSHKSSTIEKNFGDIFSPWSVAKKEYLVKDRFNFVLPIVKNSIYTVKEKFEFVPPVIGKNNYTVKERFEFVLNHSESIKVIHLSSAGEPWIQDEIYEFLNLLIEHKLHEKTEIATHTNGSIFKYKNNNMIELLKNWEERATIIMSNDGTEERGEYIRYGYKDKMWLKTYNEIKKANINTYIHYCLNIFNALYLNEDLSWFKKNCNDTDILIRYWQDPFILSLKMLKYWEHLFNEAEKIFENIDYKFIIHKNEVSDFFKSIKKNNEFEFRDDYTMFLNFIKNIDKRRNTNFIKTFPKLDSIFL